jgi:integrase
MPGSVVRRGSSHSVIVELGVDPVTGKRRQQWTTVHGTRKQADDKLVELLHQRNEGVSLPSKSMTVAAYLARWMVDYVETSLAPKTVQTCREIIDDRLVPAFGTVKLTALKPHAIQAWYAGLLKDGRTDGQPVLRYHQVLHAAFHHAARWQLLIRNPLDAVEPPRARRRSARPSSRERSPGLGRGCSPPPMSDTSAGTTSGTLTPP